MFHVTIDAEDPRRTAQLIADLIEGEALPFPVVQPASWVATSRRVPDFSIQVLRRATREDGAPVRPPHPLVLDCPLAAEDVAAIAERHGAAADRLDRSAMALHAEDGRRIEIRLARHRPAQLAVWGRLLERLGSG